MQKFVVAKKLSNDENRQDLQPAKVKMSGYLKKKRNKVGGWRKMWFVLQNQLLLSYSSKEDYDKKLVPFKDVLNLVPGTIVRPCGGSRFSIETTSKMIYNFRCDDAKTCTEWITVLVESLSMQGLCAKENGIGSPTKFNISLDNIRQMRPKRPVRSSCSWDSICRSKNSKSPKLPIAQSTARILHRNGISAIELNRIHQNDDENHNFDRARNFRLHENNLNHIQSDEVCRINKMFSRSTPSTQQTSTIADSGTISNTNLGSGDSSDTTLSSRTRAEGVVAKMDDTMENYRPSGMRKESPRDMNQNRMLNGGNFCSFEEQVKRLTLDDESGSETTTISFRRGASSPLDLGYPDEMGYGSSRTKEISMGNGSPFGLGLGTIGSAGESSSSPTTSYESTSTKVYSRLSASSDNVNKGSCEPIYAVVDLDKKKYARRAKIREMEEQMERDRDQDREERTRDRQRPKSIHVVTSDYEEVLNFSQECLGKEEDENENIYEPINIPEGNHHHRNIMWRYFPKISLEALIELTTKHKKKDCRIDAAINEPQSPFSDIRKKLGNHRKSIKNRMRRFYTKEMVNKDRNAFSDDELDSQGATGGSTNSTTTTTSDNSIKSSCGNLEKPKASFVFSEIEKYRRGEKHIFGSLSRLKKARTSLCLDDCSTSTSSNANNKKLLAAQKSASFQQELKREVNRRTSSEKKVACHSRFYD